MAPPNPATLGAPRRSRGTPRDPVAPLLTRAVEVALPHEPPFHGGSGLGAGGDSASRNGSRMRQSLLTMGLRVGYEGALDVRAVYSAKSRSRADSQMATTAGCVSFRSSAMA
jgi:hypothetical protein